MAVTTLSNSDMPKKYLIPLPKRFVVFSSGKMVKEVLDIGCGYGRSAFFMHENNYDVIGVDIDKVQVREALIEADLRGIKEKISFLVNDGSCLCFRNCSFDAVTMIGCLNLVTKANRPLLMSEARRVLKPLGYLFIEEFGRTWKNPVYSKRYKEDLGVTGELGTITVKDETGKVLHFGHHFTRREIFALLKGFHVISFEKDVFTSYYHRNWVNGFIITAQKTN